MTIVLTFLFLVAIIFYIRILWKQQKNKSGANDSIIDAEYTVIETKDPDD